MASVESIGSAPRPKTDQDCLIFTDQDILVTINVLLFIAGGLHQP